MKICWIVLAFVVFSPLGLRAEVGDPTVRTDHPQYAGEGAFQTVADCVRFATEGEQSPQDKAVALYLWMLTHQYHLASPQEWCVPGRTPDTAKTGDYEAVVYDANRSRFSYGYGLCGTVHAWNEPYWDALGMRARRRAFPGHTNSEVFYDESWHAFDTDMAGLLFREDGQVAGYEDVIANPKLADSVKPPLPHYPFAWPGDFNTMKHGWQQVAKGGNWYKLYNGGYAAHPGIVHLRSGETFTRWFDRDHFGGPTKRRFWHHLPGGPQRDWTFVNAGVPRHDGQTANARGHASYGNAEFVYRPDLPSGRYREGVASQSPNVRHRESSPRLYSRDGQPASVVFRHFSPYVICGDPLDDSNPMAAKATDGLVVRAKLVGDVTVVVSADEGQSWNAVEIPAKDETGTVRLDLTEHVKGRYGWQVKFLWNGDVGVDDVEFTTTTQVSQAIYPRLTPDGCEVTYRSGSRSVVAVLPNFALPESQAHKFEDVPRRSQNLRYTPRSAKSPRVYETTDNRPAHVVFPVAAPGVLEEVRAAVRYSVRVPPPKQTDFALEVSTDDGQTWREFAQADVPADNEFSSGWLAGTADVSAAKVSKALVRGRLHADGYTTGLTDAQLYGVHRTATPQELTIGYGWQEHGQSRTWDATIPAGTAEKSFTVPTGPNVQDTFVRLSAP